MLFRACDQHARRKLGGASLRVAGVGQHEHAGLLEAEVDVLTHLCGVCRLGNDSPARAGGF